MNVSGACEEAGITHRTVEEPSWFLAYPLILALS